MGIVKILILLIVVGVVVVIAVGGLAAFSLFNSINAEPEPISPQQIAEAQAVERKIEDAVSDNSAFYLELNDEELSSLPENDE